MATFAQAFWSTDYAGGLGVLFGKLQQGVKENQQILTIARMRADAEELYGQHLGDIGPETDKIQDGFSKDDGASVRKAYEGVRVEMNEAASKHRKIAQNIRELVVYPFGRWCEQHATRIQASQDELQARVKAHDRQAEAVKKLRSTYFNKCRLVEDLEEEDKLAFKDPSSTQSSPKNPPPTVKIQEPEEEDEPEPIKLGDELFTPQQIKGVIASFLENIKMKEVKVPILGLYQNCASGADITSAIQKVLNSASVGYAEGIGQDLISNGLLRLIGNVGNTFMNSSRANYQWRPKAFEIAGIEEPKKALGRSGTIMSTDSFDSPIMGTAKEYLAGWNPLNNPHPNETPSEKLRREAMEADERYKAGVKKQDLLRCQLEEAMFEHLKFMERCELDRLRAIKSVVLDFSGALSNVIPSLQSTVDKMMLFQETVQPLGDLRYMLENYRVGPYIPRVYTYENYYSSIDDQTFGVDLEARARADKKRVPSIVTSILTFLDHRYPLLEGDDARRAIWTIDVPLAATHRLRFEVNEGKASHAEIFERYEVPIVASLLKIYLLELPDSIVSSSLYEVIKAVYSSTDTSSSAETRVSVLQNTLGALRLTSIATLDAITTHFARLLDLTSADEPYTQQLTRTLAPCVLRPRTESALSFDEKYALRFYRDLLDHKDAIFGELKRSIASGKHGQLGPSASVYRANSTIGPLPITTPTHSSSTSTTPRPRAISTDESNRRAHTEERNRAIAQNNRSRGASPAPHRESGDRHALLHMRRESSRGPSETRFPVHVSSSSISSARPSVTPRKMSGATLEVPASPPAASPSAPSPLATPTSGLVNVTSASVTPPGDKPAFAPPPPLQEFPSAEEFGSVASAALDLPSRPASTASGDAPSVADRVNSLQRRVGADGSRKRKAGGLRSSGLTASSGSVSLSRDPSEGDKRGVELSDRPVDLD